jgi:photosystem II stability/assembly factor-like uncharacterized protein
MINLLTRVFSAIPRRVFGETWTGRDSNRRWKKVAMSGNGQYQIAYTDLPVLETKQLYVSSDYGSTWTAKESPRVWSDMKLSFDGQIQVVLENDQTSGRVYISKNFGVTWDAKGPDTMSDIYLNPFFNWLYAAVSLNGQYIVAVTSERIFFSFDSGETWTESSNTPRFGALKGISISADGQNQVILASNDVVISSNYGATWSTSKLFRRDALQPVVSSSAQIQMLFGKETQFQNFPQINVSVDFGATWVKKEFLTTRDWRKLVISADGTRAAGIVGYQEIFVSNNSGNTWVNKFTLPVTSGLSLLEMSSNGKVLVAGNNQQLFVSTDFGETWGLKYSEPLGSQDVFKDAKLSSDGTRGTAVLNIGKIYTTQRTRLI